MSFETLHFTITNGGNQLSIGICDGASYLHFNDPIAVSWDEVSTPDHFCLLPDFVLFRKAIRASLSDRLDNHFPADLNLLNETLAPLYSLMSNGDYTLYFDQNVYSPILPNRDIGSFPYTEAYLINVPYRDVVYVADVEKVKQEYEDYRSSRERDRKYADSILDYTTPGPFEEFEEGDNYEFADYESYLPTQGKENLNLDRVRFYEEKIAQGELPLVLLIEVSNAELNCSSPRYILDGHHKLMAYSNTKVNPNVACLRFLQTGQNKLFDAERLSELLYPWQMESLLKVWFNKAPFVSEPMKNPKSKLHELIKHGFVQRFYENGNRMSEANYYYDQIDGPLNEWHENGVLKMTGNYEKGAQVGIFKTYSTSGKIFMVTTYNERGIQNGLDTTYHENGRKKSEGFRNNPASREGVWTTWFSDGTVESETTYQNNKIVQRKNFNQSGELVHQERLNGNYQLQRIPTEAEEERKRLYGKAQQQKRYWINFRQNVRIFLLIIAIFLGLLLLALKAQK